MWPLPRFSPDIKAQDRASPPKKVGSMSKIPNGLQVSVSFQEALSLNLDLPLFFDQASCVGSEPSTFDGESLAAVFEAKRICSDCPIQAQCLSWATQTQDAGVWGGLTPEERKKLRGGTNPVNIGEVRWLETNRVRLLSDTPAALLAAEFEVTERTIYRWRKNMKQNQIAS